MRRTLDEGEGGFNLPVLNPVGAFEVAQQHAPRLASLRGAVDIPARYAAKIDPE